MTPLQFLEKFVGAAKLVERNDNFYAYTIVGKDDTEYITRTLFPRTGAGRIMLHRIHRADNDRHMHNHPWKESHAIILHGGYHEERYVSPGVGRTSVYEAGDTNTLRDTDYHRIKHVQPDTWTLFMAGDRVQTWGFLVDGKLVTHDVYWGIPAGSYPARSTQ